MDILVITWNFPPRRGGSEYLLGHLVAGLGKNHTVSVITSHAPAPKTNEKNIFRAPFPGLVFFAFYALGRGAGLLIRNPQINVIFGGSVMMTPLVLILARIFRRKAVVQTHGLDVVYPGLFYRWLCSVWVRFCDGIIANSVFTASVVEGRSLSRNRITVIPLGTDPERFAAPANAEATRKRFQLEGKKIVLFVGRLAKRKGVAEFVRYALPKIVAEVSDVCFVVVGENPADSLTHRADTLEEIKAAVRELGLEKSVRLLGALDDDDVTRLYQACQIVVLPALALAEDVEGFGLVLLEAAAAAKPVVATRSGGIPEAMEDEKCGILREPGDYDALSQSIIALLGDERTRTEMGIYARRRILEKFNWKRVVADYEAAFDFRAKMS